MARRVYFKPDGTRVTVDESEAGAAEEAGYRPANAAELKAFEAGQHPVRAAAEGAFRGLTLGLSDPFLKGFGPSATADERAAGLAARQEANPKAAMAGEIGGQLLGTLAMPASPAGLAGRAGLAVERLAAVGAPQTILRQVGAKALGAAAEGSLYGLGTAISEDTLHPDKETSGQKLAAMLGGASTGAGVAALTSLVGLGAKRLFAPLAAKGFKDALEELSDEALVRSLGTAPELRKGLASRGSELGKFARQELGWNVLDNAESLAVKAEAAQERIWGRIQPLLREADQRALVDTGVIAKRAEREVIRDLAKDPLAKPAVVKLRELLGDYQAQGRTFEEMWDLQSSLRSRAERFAPEVREEAAAVRRIIRDELFEQAGAVSPHLKAQLVPLNAQYAAAAKIEQLATARAAREAAGNPLGAGAVLGLPWALAFGDVAGAAKGVAASATSKAIRDRGGLAAGALAGWIASSPSMQKAAAAFERYFKALDPAVLGPFRTALERAAARGASDLLATHISLAQSDPAYLGHLGLQHETPEGAAAAIQKSEGLSELGGAIAAFDGTADKSIGRFFGAQAGRPPGDYELTPSADDFKKRVAALEARLTNTPPELPGHMHQTAPQVTAMMQLTAQNAAQFLHDKAPKDPTVGMPPSTRPPWKPDAVTLARWYRYAEAIERPAVLLECLRKGYLVPEHVEALATVYPKVLEGWKDAFAQKLATHPEALTRQQRAAVSAFLGEVGPLTSSVKRTIAQIHARARSAPDLPQHGGGPSPKADGRQTLDVERSYQTQAQRLEARGVR